MIATTWFIAFIGHTLTIIDWLTIIINPCVGLYILPQCTMFNIYYLKMKKDKNSTLYLNVININITQCRNGDVFSNNIEKMSSTIA
jgi:hypothetical protein